MTRPIYAHLEHPSGDGRTLCGDDPAHLEPCPYCLALREVLLQVHVQSPRRAKKSFCGKLLGPEPASRPEPGQLPRPFYVTVEQAMLLCPPGGSRKSNLPLCPGCESNLTRFYVRSGLGPRSKVEESHRPGAEVSGMGLVGPTVDSVDSGSDEEDDDA